MAKLTLWMQMSLDGYAEGPDHAFDWPVVGPKLQRSFIDELRHADAFVYGRRIFQMMASVWPAVETSSDAPPGAVEFARVWLPMPKFVFSQTLADADWNTTVVRGDVAPAVRALIARSPHGIVAFGGPTFATTLMRLGLVDEYQLFVHPVVLGGGTPLFGGVHERRRLQLISARSYDEAVVAIRYASGRAG
jgi:dihydrofolate reductase